VWLDVSCETDSRAEVLGGSEDADNGNWIQRSDKHKKDGNESAMMSLERYEQRNELKEGCGSRQNMVHGQRC
jgi:hypothetical protein